MRWMLYLFNWFELLGLVLWIGGMLILGMVVAPTIFDTVKPIEMAGETMALVFRKFNGGLVYVCIVLVTVGFSGKWFLTSRRDRLRWIEGVLLLVMVVSGLYIGAILGPRMQELRQIRLTDPSNAAAVVEFDRDHRLSRHLFTLNMVVGMAVLFINGRETVPPGEKRNGI